MNQNDEKTFKIFENIVQLIGNARIEIEGDNISYSDIFSIRTKYSSWITSRLTELKNEWRTKKKGYFLTINILHNKKTIVERWSLLSKDKEGSFDNNAIGLIVLLRAINMKLGLLKISKVSKEFSLELKLEKQVIPAKNHYKFKQVVYNSTYEVILDWIEDENAEKIESIPESIPRNIKIEKGSNDDNQPKTLSPQKNSFSVKTPSTSATSNSPTPNNSSSSNPFDLNPPLEKFSINTPNSPTGSYSPSNLVGSPSNFVGSPGGFVGSPNSFTNVVGTPPNLSISPFKRSLSSFSPRKNYANVLKGIDQKEIFEDLLDIAHNIRNDPKGDNLMDDSPVPFGHVHDDNGAEDFKQFCITNIGESLRFLEDLDQKLVKSFNEPQPIKTILSQINDL